MDIDHHCCVSLRSVLQLFKYDDWDDAWDDGEHAGSEWYQDIKACKVCVCQRSCLCLLLCLSVCALTCAIASALYKMTLLVQDASTACQTTIMLNAVLHSLQVLDASKRVHRETDHGCNKIMGGITPVLNGLFLLIGILEFSTKCVNEIHRCVTLLPH